MIQRYVPSKLVDYLWDDRTEDARLAFGDECEPGEAVVYEIHPQSLKTAGSHEEMLASYFDSLRFWLKAERR